MAKRLINVVARLKVFTGTLREKYIETGKEVSMTLSLLHAEEIVSKRVAERAVRQYLHSLLRREDRSGIDPELFIMAATGLQVNIVTVAEVEVEPGSADVVI